MQVWIVVDDGIKAVVVTELRTYPTGLKALNLFAIGGAGMEGWSHLIEVVVEYAKAQGCDLVEGCGRLGWVRASRWTELYRVVERRL